jgi:hypothetical protein
VRPQLLCDDWVNFWIFRQKAKECVTRDESHLAGSQGFGRHFMGLTRESCHQAENVAWSCDSQDKRLALTRTDCEFHFTLTQNVYPAGSLFLDEQHSVGWICRSEFDAIKIFQCRR